MGDVNKDSNAKLVKLYIDKDDDKGDEEAGQMKLYVDKKDDVKLCASCDYCRRRKVKCDGELPCGQTIASYKKKHKINSLTPEEIKSIPIEAFDCVYSPAKRRGPVPGRSNASKRSSEVSARTSLESETRLGMPSMEELQLRQMMLQNFNNPAFGMLPEATFFDPQQAALQQQLNLMQQLQSQIPNNFVDPREMERPARRMKLNHGQPVRPSIDMTHNGVPRTIAAHTHLLELSDPDGSRLRAYYRLSIDELCCFPPVPTDEEYSLKLGIPGMTPSMIPGTHLAVLSAARFAEVALGALVHNEVTLGMELCNAAVHCLKESAVEPVQPSYMFEVARSYFLLAVFRIFQGDKARYLKYRRVCLSYISKLEDRAAAATIIAAISYHDALIYMTHNADEKLLPNIDSSIPPMNLPMELMGATATEMEYDVKMDPLYIASDPKNKNWIQGPPPVYLNEKAPLPARALDALACAIRTCCDQANGRFDAISKEAGLEGAESIPRESILTPTTTAVLAHEKELCSKNMVMSAFTLMQQYEATAPSSQKNHGIHLVISAMDAFLDNGDEDEAGGFTDSKIQSLFGVCNTVIENPLLLFHAGPTYHLVSNAAIMLCHLLNGMYAMKGPDGIRKEGDMEAAMFEEVLDTFNAVRKLLMTHRRRLPSHLRSHGFPRPSLGLPEEGKTFIDLEKTLLCASRSSQGFVLMSCSPSEAAERARSSATKRQLEAAREAETDADDGINALRNDFDIDDDTLLAVLSQLNMS